jgi:hypothetical protein
VPPRQRRRDELGVVVVDRFIFHTYVQRKRGCERVRNNRKGRSRNIMRVWRILEGAKMMASKEKKRQWVEVRVTMMGDSYIIAVALHPPDTPTPRTGQHI